MNNPSNSEPLSKQARSETSSLSSLFQPGQTLGGRYQVISCLGQGGMGVVYHVNQVFVDKEMALKTIEKHGISEVSMRRFEQEARTALAVQHPNVISVYDFGLLDDQTPFLVMEFIQGETLAERQKRTTCLSIDEAIPIFAQICFGLAHAHSLGVVHRDIKPSNIMIIDDLPIGTEGSVKIVDFGIAKFVAAESGEKQSLTRTGEIFGSPLYMSPEQCASSGVDHRSDIYSLGCVLFETLTGTPPFIGENALATMIKHQTETPPSLKEASLGKEFPAALEQIVATMLAKSPEMRYQNLGITAHDLAATISGEAILKHANADPTKRSRTKAKDISMSRLIFNASILGTFLLSATLAGLASYNIKSNAAPPLQPPPVKTDERIRRENQVLPDISGNVQTMTLKQLGDRLSRANSDGHLTLNYKQIDEGCFKLLSKSAWVSGVSMEGADFDNKNLAYLAKLPLTYVDLKHTPADDQIGVTALVQCKKLRIIRAAGTLFTDVGITKLATLKSLTMLDLNETKVSDKGLIALGTLPQLLELHLARTNGITAKGLSALRNCPLTTIDLSDTAANDSSLEALAPITTLRDVRLAKTQVTYKGLAALCQHRNIQLINVLGCSKVSLTEIAKLRSMSPWINVIDKPSERKHQLE